MTGAILYDLFETIRSDPQFGHPGLEEYYLLLKLLRSNELAIDSFDDLAFILETCWLKSEQQRFAFRDLLENRRQGLLHWLDLLERETRVTTAAGDSVESTSGAPVVTAPPDPSIIGDPQQPHEQKQPAPVDGGRPDLLEADSDFGDTGFRLDLEVTAEKKWQLSIAAPQGSSLLEQPYLFTNDYFPIADRPLQQAWRRLINKQKARDSFDLDIDRTIAAIAHQGYFSRFLFKRQETNPLQLFIFIDQADSMIAVKEFGTELCRTARESDAHADLRPFYFNQYPSYDETADDDSVTNEDFTKSYLLKRLFAPYPKKDIVVLIYSDAGALKNELDPESVRATQEFIRRLSRLTAYTAWLNPAPAHRWTGNNAAFLSAMLPMFETSRNGLDGAIAALKGRSIIKKDIPHVAG